jgi:hypothetical protein
MVNGVGATKELSLRVSVATLVRVVFKGPEDGDLRLALERKATLRTGENGRLVGVNAQPFGGAIRIRDLERLHDLTGDFHFDSERSRSEQDFRIFIRPSNWGVVREFCLQHLSRVGDSVLETDPGRELAEEFADALKISLKPAQYIHKPIATVIEDDPTPTENIHARGYPTARIYRVFEADILDTSLARAMLANSESISNQDLCKLAEQDAQNGGKGRANAVLALPLKRIGAVYSAMPSAERNTPLIFEKTRLDETIPMVLEGISVPKYRRL